MTSLANDLRRMDERAQVARLEQMYGNALGIREGYRSMPTVRRVKRLERLYNRGNPATSKFRGPGYTRAMRKGRTKRGWLDGVPQHTIVVPAEPEKRTLRQHARAMFKKATGHGGKNG